MKTRTELIRAFVEPELQAQLRRKAEERERSLSWTVHEILARGRSSSGKPAGRLNLAEGDEPRVIATVDSYEGMLEALRTRVSELQVQGARFDSFAGLPDGYLSKLIGARPVRRIGMTSFSPLMTALGLRCLFVEDAQGTERLKSRLTPRNSSYVRIMPAAASIVFTARMLKRIRRLGGMARMARLTAEQCSVLGKKAAAARWKKGAP